MREDRWVWGVGGGEALGRLWEGERGRLRPCFPPGPLSAACPPRPGSAWAFPRSAVWGGVSSRMGPPARLSCFLAEWSLARSFIFKLIFIF